MQVTTLNKIINLFIVGAFVLTLLIFAFVYYYKDFITEAEIRAIKITADAIGAPVIALFATFAFVSVGILLGIIVDTIANLVFEDLLKKIYKNERSRLIFRCEKNFKKYDSLMNNFKQEFTSSDKYKDLPRNEDIYIAYSVGIFFHTANKENIEWAVQHYSFYLLSLNYLFVSCCVLIVTPFTTLPLTYKLGLTAVLFVFIYVLIYQAINKFLYTYEVSFRHSTIILIEEKLKESKKEQDEK